jgi:hypothetical protein
MAANRAPDSERFPGTVAMSRREVMALGAAAALTARCGGGSAPEAPAATARQVATKAGAAQTYLTPAELAMVDELSELIIPTDTHSPGARAAGVAAYIDRSLAEAFEDDVRTTWREGLRRIDELSQRVHGKAFMTASPVQRVAVLTEIARNEANPGKSPSKDDEFFVELKSRVAWAYYTSEIGLKQELEYKGNTFQATFAGFD